MFTINASLLGLAIIYSFIALKWRTNEEQRPLSEANNVITDFFDCNHVIQTLKTIIRKRFKKQRLYLILLIIAMACYTFQRDERQMSYLYLQKKLNWPFDVYSNFRTYQSGLQAVMLLIAIPFLNKLLGWRDTCIAIVGAVAHIIARIFYVKAEVGWIVYLGIGFDAIACTLMKYWNL